MSCRQREPCLTGNHLQCLPLTFARSVLETLDKRCYWTATPKFLTLSLKAYSRPEPVLGVGDRSGHTGPWADIRSPSQPERTPRCRHKRRSDSIPTIGGIDNLKFGENATLRRIAVIPSVSRARNVELALLLILRVKHEHF